MKAVLSLNLGQIVFDLYLKMRDTHLSLKLQLFKGRLFDVFKKKAEHKDKSDK